MLNRSLIQSILSAALKSIADCSNYLYLSNCMTVGSKPPVGCVQMRYVVVAWHVKTLTFNKDDIARSRFTGLSSSIFYFLMDVIIILAGS